MLKHIVMWQLKDHAHDADKAANAQHIKQRLEALKGRIDGLLHIEVGIDELHTDSSADVVLCAEFASLDALAQYQKHPEHLAVVPFIVEASSTRMVVDYTV